MSNVRGEIEGSVLRNFKFYIGNAKLAVAFLVFGIVLVLTTFVVDAYFPKSLFVQVTLSLGTGFILVGAFNVLYEAKLRVSFLRMLGDVNPNIESGVIVHSSHRSVISREDALTIYSRTGDTIRIITSTADNYVKEGEAPYDCLRGLLKDAKCNLKILLYLPIYEIHRDILVGQRRNSPQSVINEQKTLFRCYKQLISESNGGTEIRFFVLPHHTNFIMIGNSRMFGAPIMHSVGGRDLPCHEIYPTLDTSVFFKFQNDFDYIFSSNDVSLPFNIVEKIYEEENCQLDGIRARCLDVISKKNGAGGIRVGVVFQVVS